MCKLTPVSGENFSPTAASKFELTTCELDSNFEEDSGNTKDVLPIVALPDLDFDIGEED